MGPVRTFQLTQLPAIINAIITTLNKEMAAGSFNEEWKLITLSNWLNMVRYRGRGGMRKARDRN